VLLVGTTSSLLARPWHGRPRLAAGLHCGEQQRATRRRRGSRAAVSLAARLFAVALLRTTQRARPHALRRPDFARRTQTRALPGLLFAAAALLSRRTHACQSSLSTARTCGHRRDAGCAPEPSLTVVILARARCLQARGARPTRSGSFSPTRRCRRARMRAFSPALRLSSSARCWAQGLFSPLARSAPFPLSGDAGRASTCLLRPFDLATYHLSTILYLAKSTAHPRGSWIEPTLLYSIDWYQRCRWIFSFLVATCSILGLYGPLWPA